MARPAPLLPTLQSLPSFRPSLTFPGREPRCRVIKAGLSWYLYTHHLRTFRPCAIGTMADEAQLNVTVLAEQLVEGFAALSGEYQALFDQQKQVESKLSWAKQQVCDIC